ncbi:MAG: cation:proton antiporter [Paludibacter sp.]|jgi:CPA2 family monovalent cation:H+ antiporter-2|nr:cation:proton antiporter [Paludibacter sp.]
MEHLPPLIPDLALILMTAAVVAIIFKKLKQPLVLGYIVAGFIVSPFFSFTPSVSDKQSIEIWAKIGVIFLLFGLGLEFSFKKLLHEGSTVIVTAIFKIFATLALGFGIGKMLGWNLMNSLFLGGMLASSSTIIILKAFEELGLKSKQFSRTVIGILIVEDIVVVLLMVMLSSISVTQKVEGSEMLFTILKLGFFLALWFLMGIFIIPTFLKKAKKLLNDEVYLILSVGLCFAMVFLATKVGFSEELGAFIMGSILAETTSAERIEHSLKPLKDLFGAIFFVSIGMLINPALLWEHKWLIILIIVVTIIGKFLFTLIGAILSGQPLKQSVQVASSMSQISEFAFIVATLGMTLGVISDFLFPVAVGAAVVTTFTTPYMIKFSEKIYGVVEKIIPQKWQTLIVAYSSRADNSKSETEIRRMLKNISISVLTNGILIFAIIVVCTAFLLPILQNSLHGILPNIITLAVGLLLCAPFLWALMFRIPNNMSGSELLKNEKLGRNRLLIVEIVRWLLGIIAIGYLADSCFSTKITVFVIIPVFVLLLIIFSKYLKTIYRTIERRFMLNLNQREIVAAEQEQPMSHISHRHLNMTDWDLHLANLETPQNAEYIGRTLKELQWREKYDVNVVYIKRGEYIIYSPGPNVKILPFDNIGVFASDDILESFKTVFFAEQHLILPDIDVEDIVVEKICIYEDNPLINKTIRTSGIRESTGGMVVAIERDNNRILVPQPDTAFQELDIVWIVGEKKRLKELI